MGEGMPVASVRWRRLDVPAKDTCALWRTATGYIMETTTETTFDDVPALVTCVLALDGNWRSSMSTLRLDWAARSWPSPRLTLAGDAQGNWTIDGIAASHLKGCACVDIGCTPATNTIAIMLLDLAPGASATINSAWVQVPALTVSVLPQRYTRLDVNRFRYESFATNFTAELTTDAQGIVIDYGGIWRRV